MQPATVSHTKQYCRGVKVTCCCSQDTNNESQLYSQQMLLLQSILVQGSLRCF